MYRAADDGFVAALQNQVPGLVLRHDTAPYLTEPRGRWAGQGVVVAPENTTQVAAIVTACCAAQVPVVPYGGGTGLVGGQIMGGAVVPLILSLERMNAIRDVNPVENVIEAGAGAILDNLRRAADAAGRLFPLALASGGSAQIGGLLATNAGGVNVLRYGNARALCLGVEAVLPDGTIWNGLTRLRKDNTGYDLRDLLIGAEGTLGVITAATLRMVPRPVGEGTALLAVASPQAALDLLALAQDQLGDQINAFELIHRQGADFLAEVGLPVRMPLTPVPDWMVLVDLGLAAGLDPAQALETLFVAAAERGLCDDGVIAQSETQRADIWALRENIPEANRLIGSVASHDIALPLAAIPAFIDQGAQILAQIGDFRINCFGHLGDGNLHYNVFPVQGRSRDAYDNVKSDVQRAVHDLVSDMNGSFSAEHGVGRLKVRDLERYGDPAKLQMMRAIKTALDPRGIMNPGAVLA